MTLAAAAPKVVGGESTKLDGLVMLARSLASEGRTADALVLLEYLEEICPGNVEILRQLTRTLGSGGRTLEAIEKLRAIQAVMPNTEALVEEIRIQMPEAFKRFNDHVALGEIGEAEKYASALVALVPKHITLLEAALSCNIALGRNREAAAFAATILTLDPTHAGALCVQPKNATVPVGASQVEADAHPLIRLRNLYDAASSMMCGTLDDRSIPQIERLLQAARDLVVEVPKGSEWEGWAKHYRLALAALDLPMILRPTPAMPEDIDTCLATSSGAALDWPGLQATAERLGARTVFFAAADRKYVDLYARWYIKSVLKYCDVNCLVVVHVIGGADQLKSVAQSLDIADERLILAGDRFAADSVKTKCYDAPPKGLIALPVAHFQSVRFLRLGALLRNLKLPVFVSDIDLLLQRGVQDLLQRCAGDDVVFNENTLNTNAGSRLTANLVLLNPTENADRFLRFLRGYLERALGGQDVSRWIDQFGLLIARHHFVRHASNPRIGYFDTNSDINNVMYKSYQDHPFRFLSLYHGFDTSTLEGNPRVHGEQAPKAA